MHYRQSIELGAAKDPAIKINHCEMAQSYFEKIAIAEAQRIQRDRQYLHYAA